MLLLLGQRRTETAHMRWSDLDIDPDLATGAWTAPAEITKSGRAHRVPLPRAAVAIIQRQDRLASSPYVFAGRGSVAMAGWAKRLRPVREATAAAGMAPWTPHDLRRTMRSGLSALGVDATTAELMLNHAVNDELAQAYDRHDYWRRRVDTAGRWAEHVLGLVESAARKARLQAGGNVVELRRRTT
jgi:integrase